MSFKGGIVHSVLQLAARETSKQIVLEKWRWSRVASTWHILYLVGHGRLYISTKKEQSIQLITHEKY